MHCVHHKLLFFKTVYYTQNEMNIELNIPYKKY